MVFVVAILVWECISFLLAVGKCRPWILFCCLQTKFFLLRTFKQNQMSKEISQDLTAKPVLCQACASLHLEVSSASVHKVGHDRGGWGWAAVTGDSLMSVAWNERPPGESCAGLDSWGSLCPVPGYDVSAPSGALQGYLKIVPWNGRSCLYGLRVDSWELCKDTQIFLSYNMWALFVAKVAPTAQHLGICFSGASG